MGLLLHGCSRSHADKSLSVEQLATVFGTDDVVGCIQYFEDDFNFSFDCWTPYISTDNDCDWKKCSSSSENDGCGTGTLWSNLAKASWYATSATDPHRAWRARSSPCFIIIDCEEGVYDEEQSCHPGVLIGHFWDDVPLQEGQGCYTPELGIAPTGCRTCRAGQPVPAHPDNNNWIWYEEVECNLP